MEKRIIQSNSILYSASITLMFFWILNVLKEGFDAVKSSLNFYPPVGPLLGLFLSSILFFAVLSVIIPAFKPKNQKLAFWMLVLSATIFVFLVFPPIFEPIADLMRE